MRIFWFILFLLASTEVWGADWRLLITQAKDAYYFDADSVQTLENRNIRVWGREVLSEDSKSKVLKNFGKAFQSLHSASVLFEINCREKMVRALGVEYYAADGFMIPSDSYEGGWEIILPGTPEDALRNKVCK